MASPFLLAAQDGTDLGYNQAVTNQHTAPAKSGDRRSFVAAFPTGDLIYQGVNRATFCRTYLNTDTFPNRAGMAVVNVSGDAALATAINNAIANPTPTIIVVDHTVQYVGNYILKTRVGDALPGGNNIVVIISKAIYDSMPAGSWVSTVCPPMVRTTLNDTQTKMARFVNQSLFNQDQFVVDGATKGWRLIGLFFGAANNVANLSRLVRFGNGDGSIQGSAAQCPENIIADRCGFDFNATGNLKAAIEVHGKAMAVQDCYFGDNIHHDGQDCQAIRTYNGQGPYRYINNRVLATGENIIFGGAANPAGTPADCEVRWNLFEKLLSWNAAHPSYANKAWSIKNLFETKNCQYLLFEGNYMRYSWAAGQTGAACLLKDEFYGPNAGRSHDLIVRFNQIESVAQVYNIAGVSGVAIDRVACYGNVAECGAQYFTAQASLVGLGQSNHISFIHETWIGMGPINDIHQPSSSPNYSMEDCIVGATTTYGIKGSGQGTGTATLNAYCSPYRFFKNALQGQPSGIWPPNNFFPVNQAAIQFRDPATRDWALLGTTQGVPVPPPTPVLTTITVSPSSATLTPGQTRQYTALGYDQNGQSMAFTPTWSVVAGGGTINSNGLFTAGNSGGTFNNTVKASSGAVSGFASVTVNVPAPPVLTSLVVTPGGASLQPGGTQQFTAQGYDQYSNPIASAPVWSVVGGAGTISPTGLFTAGATPGAYAGAVVATVGAITDSADISIQAPPVPVLTTLVVSPHSASLVDGEQQQFTAQGFDQNGQPMASSPIWSVVNGGGTISPTGLFTAGTTSGTFPGTVKAAVGAIVGTADVSVTAIEPPPVVIPVLTSIVVGPKSVSLAKGATQQYVATGYDQDGHVMSFIPTWTIKAGGGTISSLGLFTAGQLEGTYSNTVEASSGTVKDTASVIVNPDPTPTPTPPVPRRGICGYYTRRRKL